MFMLQRELPTGGTLYRNPDIFIRTRRDKLYKVECSLCSQDKELFPEPFWMTSSKFKNRIPCGCSPKPEWSTHQKEVLIRRRCVSLGYSFLGWKTKGKTKYLSKDHIVLHNPATDNTWSSFTFTDFITTKYTDPAVRGKGNLRDISYHLTNFKNTGAYSEGTKFERINRLDTNGAKNYWKVTCGRCKSTYECFTGGLTKGQKGCSCQDKGAFNKCKPANFYIVRWYGYGESYLKFGITNREVIDRVKEQDKRSKHLDYEILYTFYNDSGQVVWDCEKYLIDTMNTKICPKHWLPDGYTETVEDNVENLNYILYNAKSFNLTQQPKEDNQ